VTLILATAAFGLVAGVISGVLGIGGGALVIPWLVLVGGLSQHEAQGTALMMVLPVAVVATITLRRRGVPGIRDGFVLGSLGAAGAAGGAAVALALPEDLLRFAFAALLALIGARMLHDALRRDNVSNHAKGEDSP
jgi:uncharacterized protein